jgi:putative hemin transport protein
MNAVVESQSLAAMNPADDDAVRAQFAERRASGLRARDAAQAMGLSEGAVIAAHAGLNDGPLQARALHGEWLALLQGLEACGTVMALTRNESTVHEKTGVYQNLSATGPVGLALSREIDLRLFFRHWHAGFSVTEPARQAGGTPTRSLQFFDAAGQAVHKIYAREASDMAAWNALEARFADPALRVDFTPAAAVAAPQPDAAIDVPGLSEAWAAMQDTHEFFELLRRFGVERKQAFRLVPQFCEALPRETVSRLLGDAAIDGVPIMVFVGNAGCIQIHTGPVQQIVPMDTPGGAQWINVLDKGFNLHLRTDLIEQVWLVQKPTADGIVTSIEVFDTAGDNMAMFFGERKPGQPELQTWRDLLARLPRGAVTEAA